MAKVAWEMGASSLGARDGGHTQMPHTLAPLELLTDAFLQDFGSLPVLHLYFPLLCQDPGFLIGQSIPKLLGDFCLLLSPCKRTPAGMSSCRKLKDHITTGLQIKTRSNISWSIRMATI